MLVGLETGLGGRSRTSDLLIPNQALYQLSYTQLDGVATQQHHHHCRGVGLGRCWLVVRFMGTVLFAS